MNKSITELARIFDIAESCWENRDFQKRLSGALVFVFLLSLALIQLNILNVFPAKLASLITKNHFDAVTLIFTILLIKEVVDMIFSISRSVSITQMKQLKVLSLVLIRAAFKALGEFSHTTAWPGEITPIYHMASSALAALGVFVIVLLYNRIHRVMSLLHEEETRCFIAEKKSVALFLLLGFFMIGMIDIFSLIDGKPFHLSLDIFFSLFVFADIIVVLISLRYSRLYAAVFRNSAFALATVLIRIALTAPPYYQEAVALFASVFAYAVNYAYRYILVDSLENQKDFMHSGAEENLNTAPRNTMPKNSKK